MIAGHPGGRAMASHYSIGEVLELLKDEFPDVTISKIRFLESQGLIEPERTPSGYRKFSEEDIDRLRWVLVQQRDHFLPLRVIRERLDGTAPAEDDAPEQLRLVPPQPPVVPTQEVAVDSRPEEKPETPKPAETSKPAETAKAVETSRRQAPKGGGAPGAGPRIPAIFADRPRPESRPPDLLSVSLTAAELADTTGLTAEQVAELEHFGILVGTSYGGAKIFDDQAVVVAKAAAGLLAYGLEPRHLRSYLLSAEREAGLIEQAVTPLRRHRDAASRERAAEVVEELTRHGDALRSALVRRALGGPGR